MQEKKDKSNFARYGFIRGMETLWMGKAEQKGSRCRQVCMTSPDWASPFGTFQVYSVQGVSQGVVDGTLHTSPPELLFDADFADYQAAEKKFSELAAQSQKEGFDPLTMQDWIDFQIAVQRAALGAGQKPI